VPGLAAAAAGLDKGYVITALDGQAIHTLADLRAALFVHHPGDSVTLSYLDPLGNPGTASLTLGDGPPQ
jgi:S1-C subfamily serine protease